MTFKPWQSWNPNGRPKGQRTVETLFRDAIAKLAEDNPDIVDYERDLVTTIFNKAKDWDLKALEMYLDRLYGKPKQNWSLEVTWDLFSTMLNKVREKEKE